MEEIRLPKIQKLLYKYILEEYAANGKFVDTNRQLGKKFSRMPNTMQYNLRMLQNKGLVTCETVVEESGYVVRHVTPKIAEAQKSNSSPIAEEENKA